MMIPTAVVADVEHFIGIEDVSILHASTVCVLRRSAKLEVRSPQKRVQASTSKLEVHRYAVRLAALHQRTSSKQEYHTHVC